MTLRTLCWLATAAYGAHILEELALDWRGYVRALTGQIIEAEFFFTANALVLLLGAVCAEVAPELPMVALAFPALMLINATFFHVAGLLFAHGRFSPGLITSVVLFYPLGLGCYWSAYEAGRMTRENLLGSIAIGAFVMAVPIILLRLRKLSCFRQN